VIAVEEGGKAAFVAMFGVTKLDDSKHADIMEIW
jgi:hypothetical protein